MKDEETKQRAKQKTEEWTQGAVDALRTFLYRHARGRKNGKTRDEVFAHMRSTGHDIEDKDGRRLRNMLDDLVRHGYPCFTSPVFGHYYAESLEDLTVCVSARQVVIDEYKKFCKYAKMAWEKEKFRVAGGNPSSE